MKSNWSSYLPGALWFPNTAPLPKTLRLGVVAAADDMPPNPMLPKALLLNPSEEVPALPETGAWLKAEPPNKG